jgi:hypothetical protein
MTVLAPSQITAVKVAGSNALTVDPTQIGAGMLLTLTFQPTTVSFGNVEAMEKEAPASNQKGYFKTRTAIDHSKGQWQWAGENNAEINDTVALFLALGEGPTEAGSFEWDIPIFHRCTIDRHQGIFFKNFIQSFDFTIPKTMTVTKFGVSDSRVAK